MFDPETIFWAKLHRDPDTGEVQAIHPLADHGADVGACTEALLRTTVLRQRLARTGGLDDLSEIQIARLSALATLHDLGKANRGFQNKALAKPSFTCGHVREAVNLLDMRHPLPQHPQLFAALDVEILEAWADEEESIAIRLLLAALCHHGRPWPIGNPAHCDAGWRPAGDGGRDPANGLRELVAVAKRGFPEAWETGGELLPSAPELQHAFSGLVMLADWLGSDEQFFPFRKAGDGDRWPLARNRAAEVLRWIGLDPRPARAFLGSIRPGFDRICEHSPRPAQGRVLELEVPGETGEISVLEAETGSGKTEAALARYLHLFHAGRVDGLYFALPTRTAATQIHGRVVEAVRRAFPDEDRRPPVVLAVPGYLRVDDQNARRLAPFEVLWDDTRPQGHARGWAAEHPKRYLAGAVVVGTIDQVLLATLTVSHAHMRATALSRHLLVVDEVHASDAYMNKLLESVLVHHRAAGGSAFLMSATLGAEQRERFLHLGERNLRIPSLSDALDVPFPAVFHRPSTPGSGAGESDIRCIAAEAAGEPKHVLTERLPRAEDLEWIAKRALRAAAAGARVLVLRNTVMDALVTQQALEELTERTGRLELLFSCTAASGANVPAVHHARFSRPDRVCLDRTLEARYGKEAPQEGGCVVVTTQTAEQSLDLDADLLITDLCPMDVLLQRIGRLHRHRQRDPHRPPKYGKARVLVLVPEDRDLGVWIRKDGEARGPHGWGTVYEDLAVLEATWETLEETPDFGIPEDNRRLVESAVHPEVLERLAQERGGAWAKHRENRLGALSADLSTAAISLLKRDQEFGEATFPNRETSHRITTRLGADDRVALFEETERQARPPSIFDPEERVESLTIPESWSRGAPEGAAPELLEVRETGFDFRFGTRAFIYDRRGLRPLEGEGGRIT